MSAMITGAVVGAAVIGGSAYMNAKAADKAAAAQKRASKDFATRLDQSATDVEKQAGNFVDTLNEIDTNFDPYKMDQAFNSLYEAVIMPMERSFSEDVLPAIQAGYSGGVMGAESMLSGAANQQEGKAKRDLSQNAAQLRFQERDKAIARNYAEYDRRVNLAQNVYRADTAGPLMRAQQAPQILNAESNTIAAQLAAAQAKNNIFPSMFSGAMGGLSAGASLSGAFGGSGLVYGGSNSSPGMVSTMDAPLSVRQKYGW